MKLHALTISMMFALGAAVALGDELPTTERDLAWGQAVARALPEAPRSPVQARTTVGAFTKSERAVSILFEGWTVHRLQFPDAATLLDDIGRYRPEGKHAGAFEVRGQQLVVVEGPPTEARRAVRVLAAAWGVLPCDEPRQLTIVFLPRNSKGSQSVMTTTFPADHELREPVEALRKVVLDTLAVAPEAGCVAPDAYTMCWGGQHYEVRRGAASASWILVDLRNQALGRDLLTAIGGRPMDIDRPGTGAAEAEAGAPSEPQK